MKTRLLFLEDADTLEFEAEVFERISLPRGQWGVILESTYFHPSGGGQGCDLGTIGEANVVDVYKDPRDGSRVVHVLDKEIIIEKALAHVEPRRRIRNMQQHTAQHILSQCFLKELGMDTVSVKINADSPSTLDLDSPDITEADLERIETCANQVVFEDRVIRSYIVTPQQAQQMVLRRQVSVDEDIRIVEIEGLDMTPCGGTHCRSTGSIGMIGLLRKEHVNRGKTRVHFTAGWQTLDILRESSRTIRELNALFGSPEGGAVAATRKQAQQLSETQAALRAAQDMLIPLEAKQLVETGKEMAGRRVVFSCYNSRSTGELRTLAGALAKMDGVVAVLLNLDVQKFTLVASTADNSGINARELLHYLLEPPGGRGGGDQQMAQGGGLIKPDQAQDLIHTLQALIDSYEPLVPAKKS